MTKREKYFSNYAEYHRTKGNKLTHYLGIPLIVFSVFGFFAAVRAGEWFDLGLILWLVSSVFYLRVDWKRGLPFSLLIFVFYYVSRWVDLRIHLALFIAGWI